MDDTQINSGSIRTECDNMIDYMMCYEKSRCQNVIFKLDI